MDPNNENNDNISGYISLDSDLDIKSYDDDILKVSIGDSFHYEIALLTGVTGLVGMFTLAKLLRDTKIKRIFVCVRQNKKGSAQERFDKLTQDASLLEHVVFHDCDLSKVEVIDIDLTRLESISNEDLHTLKQTTVLIHCAASTDWTADLYSLLDINVHSATKLLKFAIDYLPHLKSYVHTSTAYSCFLENGIGINPETVSIPINGDFDIKQVVEHNKHLFSNNYTLTKHIAEVLLTLEYRKYLQKCLNIDKAFRFAIVRPAVVTNSIGDGTIPQGWGNDLRCVNAAFFCWRAKRDKPLTPIVPYSPQYLMHTIPVDMVANTLIAVTSHNLLQDDTRLLADSFVKRGDYFVFNHVYNSAPSEQDDIKCTTFYQYFLLGTSYFKQLKFTRDRKTFERMINTRTILPATFIGKRKDALHLKNSLMLFSTFGHNHYTFPTDNVTMMYKRMSKADRLLFSPLCNRIDYKSYVMNSYKCIETMVKQRQLDRKATAAAVRKNKSRKNALGKMFQKIML